MVDRFLVPQIDSAHPDNIPEALSCRLGPYADIFTKMVGITLSTGGINTMAIGGSRSPIMPMRYITRMSDIDILYISESPKAQAELQNKLKGIMNYDPVHPNYFGGEPYPFWWIGPSKDMEVGLKFFQRGELLSETKKAYNSQKDYEASAGILSHKVVEAVPLLSNTPELDQAKQLANNMPPEFKSTLLTTYMERMHLIQTGARSWFKSPLEYMNDQGWIMKTISRIHHLMNNMHYMPGNKQWDIDAMLMAPDIVEEMKTLMHYESQWGENGVPLRQAIASIDQKFQDYLPAVLKNP